MKVVIVGRAASGKDYLRKRLEKNQFTFFPSYTTRAPRTGEKDGQDYHFLSVEKFEEMKKAQLFYEWVSFGDALYGTSKLQFESKENSVLISSPNGLRFIPESVLENIFIVWLEPAAKHRKERLKLRGMTEKAIAQRDLADQQFDTFVLPSFGICITDPFFDPLVIMDVIRKRYFKKTGNVAFL